jgi:hypothetical protein
MVITLEGMKFVESSLGKLLKEDLPIRMSYRLSKLYELLIKEMTKVEEFRQELVKKHGTAQENGTIKVTEENLLDFTRDYGELMAESVDIGDFEPIDIDQMMNYSEKMESLSKPPISISAFDIHQLKLVGLLMKQGE